MQIYLINLARHVDRRRRIEDLLSEMGLSFHCIKGLDGARLRERKGLAPYRPGALPASRTELSRYEIACLLSHRAAWRRLLRSGESHCVVLEDDVHFGKNFAAFVGDPHMTALPFDIIKLESFAPRVLVKSSVPSSIGSRAVYPLLSHNPGAAGYVLSRAAAARLLALSRTAPDGADTILFNLDRLKEARLPTFRIGQVIPGLVVQDSTLAPAQRDLKLTSYIAGRRGKRLSQQKRISLSRLRKNLMRPIAKAYLNLHGRRTDFA